MNGPLQLAGRPFDGAEDASRQCAPQAQAPFPVENDQGMPGSKTLRIKGLIAVVLIGFGVAHVIGAIIISRSTASDQGPSVIVAVHTD
jgi:hypothetical protein